MSTDPSRYRQYSLGNCKAIQLNTSCGKGTFSELGGRVILPSNALRRIARWEVPSPFIFRIYSIRNRTNALCGVLTFDGNDDEIQLPIWVYEQLKIRSEDRVKVFVLVEKIPDAISVVLQPECATFLSINNPKSALEESLSRYTCLSLNDHFDIAEQSKTFRIIVNQIKPANTVTVTNCDLTVDFLPPVNYNESLEQKAPKNRKEESLAERTKPDPDYILGKIVFSLRKSKSFNEMERSFNQLFSKQRKVILKHFPIPTHPFSDNPLETTGKEMINEKRTDATQQTIQKLTSTEKEAISNESVNSLSKENQESL